VIYEYVYDTHPPKQKFYVIIGIADDKIALGTVYINSDINTYFLSKPELLSLQIPISASDYPFLKWDSFINCTDIQERLVTDVAACINSGTGRNGYCSTIAPNDMDAIIAALDNSRLIPLITKKKYGIRKSS
jgi:hypothetical protein